MAKRTKVIEADPDTFEFTPNEVENTAADFAVVVRTVGGAFQCGAHRMEVAPGVFETTHVIFQWESYAPAQRLLELDGPDEAPEPVSEAAEPAEVA